MNLKWWPGFLVFGTTVAFLFQYGVSKLGTVDTCGASGCGGGIVYDGTSGSGSGGGGSGGGSGSGSGSANCLSYPISIQQYDAGTAVTPRVVYIADGDSISYGAGAPNFDGYTTIASWMLGDGVAFSKQAISGTTMRDIDAREEAGVGVVIGQYPKAVVSILGGVNDWGTTPGEGYLDGAVPSVDVGIVMGYLEEYCAKVHAQGGKVLVITMYPVSHGADGNVTPEILQLYRAEILASWTTFADALFDLGGQAALPDGGPLDPPWLLASDHLHPGIDLHIQAAQTMTPLLKPMLGL